MITKHTAAYLVEKALRLHACPTARDIRRLAFFAPRGTYTSALVEEAIQLLEAEAASL